MPGYPMPSPRFVGQDALGLPLPSGELYAYLAGTSTPAPVFFDADLTNAHAQPVVLNSRGEASVYLFPSIAYKLVLKDADGVVQWTQDDIRIPTTAAPASSNDVPVGTVMPWPTAAAPSGYLLCDGSIVSRAVYAALFAVVAELYGAGDGVSTFALPDLRGRFPLGKAASGTGAVLGGTGGALDHTHTIAAHSHTLTAAGTHTHTVPRTGWGESTTTPSAAGTVVALNNTHGAQQIATTNRATGSGGAHTHTIPAAGTLITGAENPAFRALNFIVKV